MSAFFFFRANRLEISGWLFFYFQNYLQGVRELIFTENRYDRSIEWMMKGVPNFYARSSGIVVTGKFEYTAEMCDCRLCEHYGGKLRGCKVPRCVCLEERIAVGVASLKEVMKETMSEIKHSGFNRRLRTSIGQYSFKGNSQLESIHIPDNVRRIGDYAFADCSKLKTIIFDLLPFTVTIIQLLKYMQETTTEILH